MARAKDPAEVVATIRRSIEVSTRGSRRLRFYRLRDLFGFQTWSGQRKELVARLLADQGIAVQPTRIDKITRLNANIPTSELT